MYKVIAIASAFIAPLIVSYPAQAADCSRLPKPSANQSMIAETQIRLSAVGRTLTVDGAAGPATRSAVASWERSVGIAADGKMSAGALGHLRKQTAGTYSVTVDKSDRKMYVQYRGKTVTSVKVSTASGNVYTRRDGSKGRAVTPEGSFRIFRSEPGWYTSRSLDGCLYKPLFFNGGIAIHGSMSVPNYDDSAGCVRDTPAAQEGILRILGRGSVVKVRA